MGNWLQCLFLVETRCSSPHCPVSEPHEGLGPQSFSPRIGDLHDTNPQRILGPHLESCKIHTGFCGGRMWHGSAGSCVCGEGQLSVPCACLLALWSSSLSRLSSSQADSMVVCWRLFSAPCPKGLPVEQLMLKRLGYAETRQKDKSNFC